VQVCVDIDLATFQPSSKLGGQHTHWVVVFGHYSPPCAEPKLQPSSSARVDRGASSAASWPQDVAAELDARKGGRAPPEYLLVQQSGGRAPLPTVWSTPDFLASWSGDGWRGRYRKRLIPAQVGHSLSTRSTR
jgi:hypothetical protein